MRTLPAIMVLACGCSLSQAAEKPAPPTPSTELRLPAPQLSLPDAVDLELRLQHRSHTDLPASAPSVVVHAPAGLQPESATVVLYLHGWDGCARAVVAKEAAPCLDGGDPASPWGLADRHDAAGSNSILVVPQLAWRANSGNPGRFGDPAFAQAWLAELTEQALEPLGVETVDDLVIVAHSGGYLTALKLLDAELPVRSVVLLDALYGGGKSVADWVLAAPRRKAVSLHGPHPGTTSQSGLLGQRVKAQRGPDSLSQDPPVLEEAIEDHDVVVARSQHSHGAIPAAHLAEVLGGLSLGVRGDGLADR